MQIRRRQAVLLHQCDRSLEAGHLLVHLWRIDDLGRSQVAEQAFNLHVLGGAQHPEQLRQFVEAGAQTRHAGIDLQVYAN